MLGKNDVARNCFLFIRQCLLKSHDDLTEALKTATANHKKLADSPPRSATSEAAYAVSEGDAKDAKILKRGDPQKPGDEVPRHLLQILGGGDVPDGVSGRLQLAELIASKDNPLTARVMVNRIWQHHFGRGLVASPSDFGVRGSPPSNTRLLDCLASEFMNSGWSIKAMHRLIMNSHAYRLSSDFNDKNAAIDASNVYLWRFSRQRLDADAYRDSLLFVSGTLDFSPAPAHPFPAESTWHYTQHNPFEASYPTHKRSVYFFTQRSRRPFFFDTFDGADPNTTVAERASTTTPMQALFMLNSSSIQECADGFAKRILAASSDDRNRLNTAFRLAYSRQPEDGEVDYALKYFAKAKGMLKMNAKDAELAAWSSYLRAVLCSDEFLYCD